MVSDRICRTLRVLDRGSWMSVLWYGFGGRVFNRFLVCVGRMLLSVVLLP